MSDQPLASVPRTTLDAIRLANSSGAEALLRTAARLAGPRNQVVRPEDLFVAALAIGTTSPEPSPTTGFSSISSSFASAPSKNSTAADSWLRDWLAKKVGFGSLDRFMLSQLRGDLALLLRTYDAAEATQDAELSPAASALLGRALVLAGQTSSDHRYGVRHIVASLILPDRNGANESLHALVRENLNVRLADAADTILASAVRNIPTDMAAAWRAFFKNPPATPVDAPSGTASGSSSPSEASPEPADPANVTPQTGGPILPGDAPRAHPEFPIITLSGFASDSVTSGSADPLGINPDVRALSRLICLEQATPPLSICLFGEWGSGKSTFMERMQQEIARLTKPSPGGKPIPRAPAADDEPKFVENIVQIKFNAWHFADASLWASLTAVFFDQLRRGGYDGGRASDYQALIGKVASRVRSLEADAASALEKVEDAKRKSDAAHKALDTAEKQLAASDLTLAWTELQSDFESLRKANENKLKEVGRRVYRDDLSTDTKAFAAAVAEAASTPGRIALIGRVLVGGGWPTWLGGIAILLIGCVGIILPTLDTTNLATWAQRIAGWGGGTFMALMALWRAFDRAKPILDGAWKYAKAVEDARAKLTLEVEKKRQEAEAAADKVQTAEAALASARAPLSVYRDGMPADSPSTVLRYFLFEDGDIRDYDKQVSIVSRARRSFEQLNAIVATTRMNRQAAEQKRTRGEPLTPEEQSLLEPADGKALLVPDRIVLFIDDLDRCTHDQVYAVLQAIHLLLAFELFVVVVGVDVRWIEGAVAKHFEADVAQTNDDKERRKRAIDYLEKIFQIPFWLRRLNTGTGAASSGGSYGAYVRELLKDNERAKPGLSVFKSMLTPSGPSPDQGSVPDVELPTQEPANIAFTANAGLPEPEDEFGAVDAALASLKLEPAEINFLASPEIGAVASKSPRAVKRLINIYRIVRARMSDAELVEFLGQSGKAPQFPVAALLGAIETGQPIELAESLYPALDLLPRNARLNFIWTAAERSSPDKSSQATEALISIKDRFAVLGSAIAAADRSCGQEGASVGSYLDMARLVRRYSFNRYD